MNTSPSECIICMLNQPENDDRLLCSHSNFFCKKCIDECIEYNIYDCPFCKRSMNVHRQTIITISSVDIQLLDAQELAFCHISYGI